MNLALPEGAEEKLAAYLALLAKWNNIYNLTAIRDPAQMVTHHVLDSLAVLPHLDDIETLADVGSGAGLPGIPLAIVRPDLKVASIEASQKKSTFQQQAKIELGLDNVSIHCGRSEVLKRTFDAAISRAFASLTDFARYAGHLSDRLLAMKGAYPADELAALPAGWKLGACHSIEVPGLGAQRHLLILERA
ncbi:MAG: 16S rRNA (guanine(527)-N(7))-methyltransferase RsmG [Candidatus Nitricoxidivorans perseverans]|uniref:Ribosomal RNA small subunit methyltransferase G n=1 Tax=Candidatus Nitricoxidivorans perseverans TaxID=2975601 RepID=A0AA49FP12_9PROT|nr:MAG: 16S rRNA (guanine(527)-N(7))-methyltransferase RsmG [Candidatus Nitricoxidivorans perseverans]